MQYHSHQTPYTHGIKVFSLNTLARTMFWLKREIQIRRNQRKKKVHRHSKMTILRVSYSIEPKITMRNCYIFIVVKCQNETDAGTLNENGQKMICMYRHIEREREKWGERVVISTNHFKCKITS